MSLSVACIYFFEKEDSCLLYEAVRADWSGTSRHELCDAETANSKGKECSRKARSVSFCKRGDFATQAVHVLAKGMGTNGGEHIRRVDLSYSTSVRLGMKRTCSATFCGRTT